MNWNSSSQSTGWNGNSHSQSAGWNGSSRSQSTGWHGASHGQDPYGAYAQPPELEEEEDHEDEEAGDTFMVSSSGLRWQLGWSAHTCSPAAVLCAVATCCWTGKTFVVSTYHFGCLSAAGLPTLPESWVAAGRSVPFPEYLPHPHTTAKHLVSSAAQPLQWHAPFKLRSRRWAAQCIEHTGMRFLVLALEPYSSICPPSTALLTLLAPACASAVWRCAFGAPLQRGLRCHSPILKASPPLHAGVHALQAAHRASPP